MQYRLLQGTKNGKEQLSNEHAESVNINNTTHTEMNMTTDIVEITEQEKR